MKQIRYVCRIEWGKFSYFLPPEWVFSTSDDPEVLRVNVEKRWQVIKGTKDVSITHFQVLQVRDDVDQDGYQIGA